LEAILAGFALVYNPSVSIEEKAKRQNKETLED